MMNISPLKSLFISSIFALLLFSACNKNSSNRNNLTKDIDTAAVIVPKKIQIQKVTFYLENSASMFGYVNGHTEYVNVITELARKAIFAQENTAREFYFINGGEEIQITPIGNEASSLENRLNPSGFNVGMIKESNLNKMFQIALNKAVGDSISILISDGIYDVGDSNPITEIELKSRETRSKFIERLSAVDFQTILIKLNSSFKGDYYFTSIKGIEKLDQKRPYYIWIFGKSELLNKYFPEEYITKKLKGYKADIRFLKFDQNNIQYQPISTNSIGRFRFDHRDHHKLTNAQTDRHDLGFAFSIAVDFSSLPFSDSYYASIDNYEISNNFKIISIEENVEDIFEVIDFKPTHILNVHTDGSPYGNLEINLKNVIPSWIEASNIDDDSNIRGDTLHTIGFKYLSAGITEAYQHFATSDENVISLTIEITQ